MTEHAPPPAPARTEMLDPRYDRLEQWPTATLLSALLDSQLDAAASVRAALPALETAMAEALPRLERGGRLFYIGAGTSGRLGLQDGVELIPTYGWPRARLVLLLAGGDAALFSPVEGAEDDQAEAVRAVQAHTPTPDDVVIGIAASGGTPYTCAAIAHAREAGSLTIGMACSPDSRLLAEAHCPVLTWTGAEVIAGSTRMKAGTAQKITLNLFSTGLMVRLGHTWRGQMVDMRLSNAKLVHRAHRMLRHLTDCTQPQAEAALKQADGSIKLATLLLRGQSVGLQPAQARSLLALCNGRLGQALERLGQPAPTQTCNG